MLSMSELTSDLVGVLLITLGQVGIRRRLSLHPVSRAPRIPILADVLEASWF